MKKFVLTLFLIVLSSTAVVFADDSDLPATGDLWDTWNTGRDFYGQDKSVSDEDFDKTVNKLKEKKDKYLNKFKKKQIPKGEEFSQSNETEILNEHADKENSLPVISLPVELLVGAEILPVGHYQIEGEKKDNRILLNFYQVQYLMASVPAIETEDDFEQDTITFADWKPEKEDAVKIIYGSVDFNAYAILKIFQR